MASENPKTSCASEYAFKTWTGIQEQIRFADTKAAFIFAINTLMCGFVARLGDSLQKGLVGQGHKCAAIVSLCALIVFAVCALSAVCLLMAAVFPRLGKQAPRVRIFFGHIAPDYQRDYEKYLTAIGAMSDSDWLHDLGTQIVETSNIAFDKHWFVSRATLTTMAGLLAWVIAVFASMFITGS